MIGIQEYKPSSGKEISESFHLEFVGLRYLFRIRVSSDSCYLSLSIRLSVDSPCNFSLFSVLTY